MNDKLSTLTPDVSQTLPTETVHVNRLVSSHSPRVKGEDPSHVRVLADSCVNLPPILVHRPSMRVIDGMHRLLAAKLRGDSSITVRFFDGDEAMAFVVAVSANTTHGLPLSLADREAAAARILRSYPTWSDRAIAVKAGLAAKTVAAIRRRLPADRNMSDARTGRDGRVRPVNATMGRRRAVEEIISRPEASVREIAQAAGVSVGTAHSIRQRMRRGGSPKPDGPKHRLTGPTATDPDHTNRATGPGDASSPTRLLENLKHDPSMRFTDSGRDVLRWLGAHVVDPDECSPIPDRIPPHCMYVVAELATGCAAAWRELAEELRRRVEPAP